jgi:transposase
MKKLKKVAIKENKTDKSLNKSLFNDEVKCSRITINSRICNEEKFNQFFKLISSVHIFKNLISQYCYQNRFSIISDYSSFLTQYKQFNHEHLNSWERQTIYQEIAGHYSETLSRYLNQARYIVVNKGKKSESYLIKLCRNIDKNSKIIINNEQYILDFDIELKLQELNEYKAKYDSELKKLINDINADEKEKIKLENKIKSYDKLIKQYTQIKLYKEQKPLIYDRIIDLIRDKKVRLINKVKLAEYKTGTHARNLDNAQISIVKDSSNGKYQYFLKVRVYSKLNGREPKLTEKTKNNYPELLKNYEDNNFIYLPISYNKGKLKDINRTLETILTQNNPQILIKAEQLRLNKKSRKIHIIFNYEEKNPLATKIEESLFFHKDYSLIAPKEENTLGLDVNAKNNLLADSNGKFYDAIFKNDSYLNRDKNDVNNENKNDLYNDDTNSIKSIFMDNVNEIVRLNAIAIENRTEKEKYRYERLLRTNESLIKAYLSVLVKDWKEQGIEHLVLEDLNLANDKSYSKSYYEHAGIKIKYSRLIRLLRLNQIKHWLVQLGEKQGIFVHWVNPAYSSQECNNCHHISDKNRKTQEEFKCEKCHHELNADTGSAINIKERVVNKTLRKLLSKDNVYLCARSNGLYYKEVKAVIDKVYHKIIDNNDNRMSNSESNKESNRVVTELLSV